MKLRTPNYAEVASTMALTLALGTGGAYAAEVVTGKDIVKNAVTSKHVKNGTVKEKDLDPVVKAKLHTRGATGPAGPRGATGATGATGDPGAPGAPGPRGASAWDTIPSGVTVRGQEYVYLRGSEGVVNVRLPAAAPSPLTSETVNFAGTSPSTNDDDPSCTGTFAHPTAPVGKVCLYLGYLGNATYSVGRAWADPALRTGAFFAQFETAASDVDSVYFTWAYTAP